MAEIRVGIIGVGNCASSLVQGVHYYSRDKESCEQTAGLMHYSLGGYTPRDIKFVSAFDIDKRKVGKDLSEAIFAEPNCTKVFYREVPALQVEVKMGKVLDSIAPHLWQYPEERAFRVAKVPEPAKEEVVEHLRETRTEVLLNYLPVGSEEATRFYTTCALEAGCAFVNCIPVFIASDESWARRFAEKRLPIIGDDIKSQVGATIVHRVLTNLIGERGGRIIRTYQLNTGGNTDFLNMLDRSRLRSKKTSKTDAVLSVMQNEIGNEQIHIGPSDYVPWQQDNKLCFMRIEWEGFGGVVNNLELRLSVEDSPNSAGVAIDAIRCCKLALDNKVGGVLVGPSSYFMKHPPVQYNDSRAREETEHFIAQHT
ncbi:inositol-3-phosphate synthase [Candidatus Pacearchaeota archaeon]|nr:MAG: inositol-3-phosphate synthase [Candidatus Pacearchaeota archaeon]